ncbi:hypothetical protein GCM10020221_24870 [Streptomyces thioluteus]|uniref:Uncharacterized protein n=1 Tax=Streptomyces thioluteus TaxID=66431 RepID=A0ABN3WTZ9_STRTU
MDEPVFRAVGPGGSARTVQKRVPAAPPFPEVRRTWCSSSRLTTIEEAVRLGRPVAANGHGRIEQFDDAPDGGAGHGEGEGAGRQGRTSADFVGAVRGLKRLSGGHPDRAERTEELAGPSWPPGRPALGPRRAWSGLATLDGAKCAGGAVVLDDADRLHGWVAADAVVARAGASGTVRDRPGAWTRGFRSGRR